MNIEEFKKQKEKNIKFFIDTCNYIWKNKYNYEEMNFQWFEHKVKIICPNCGTIEITPQDHLEVGCWKCYLKENGVII